MTEQVAGYNDRVLEILQEEDFGPDTDMQDVGAVVCDRMGIYTIDGECPDWLTDIIAEQWEATTH